MSRGDYEELEGNWSGTTAAAAGDRIYSVTNGALFAIDPANPTTPWAQLEGTWDTIALVSCGASLLAFERSGSLYRIASGDGSWTELDGTYVDLKATAGTGGVGYAIEGVSLYRVALDGAWTQLSGSWDTNKMAALGDALFMIERGGALYRAEAATGAWRELEGTWANTTAACGHRDGRLYIVDNGSLYDVDPDTGTSTAINSGWTTQHLVSCGPFLFAFEESGSLFKITV